jgi:crotonobetainyl-CoA:carnitine CoA-transferase CaiB-like acyl-CoA transferase
LSSDGTSAPDHGTPLALLSDVKIVAFTQFLLGPAAVQYLADMGADVVKVEHPSGAYERTWSGGNTWVNGVSAFFLLAHRNVRSVTLNLKHPEGIEAARRLIAEADVLVENFRPGVMERLGLGHEALRAKHPRLIYASASGYGTDSPYRGLPGQDLLLQAMTGLAHVTGQAGQPPTAAGAAVVDQHAATLLALGIAGALYHRSRTGEGQRLEVSMVQAALDLQAEPVTYDINGGTVERPNAPVASAFHEGPYGFYPTRDGHVALSLSPIALIRKALGGPEELAPFEDPAVAFEQREEIYRALCPLLEDFTTAALVEHLQEHGIWCAPVNDYATALADPVVAHLEPVIELDHPEAGPVRLLKHPIRYDSGEFTVRHQPPSIGQHTDEALRQAGYSDDEIARLRDAGAI